MATWDDSAGPWSKILKDGSKVEWDGPVVAEIPNGAEFSGYSDWVVELHVERRDTLTSVPKEGRWVIACRIMRFKDQSEPPFDQAFRIALGYQHRNNHNPYRVRNTETGEIVPMMIAVEA